MFRDTVPAPDPLAGPSPSPGGAGMAKLVKEEGTIMQEEEVRKKWRKKRKERNMLCRRRNRNHLQRYRPTQRVHFQTLVLTSSMEFQLDVYLSLLATIITSKRKT